MNGKSILEVIRNCLRTEEMGKISEGICLVLLACKLQLITKINYPNYRLGLNIRLEKLLLLFIKLCYVVTILLCLGVVRFFPWQTIHMYLAAFSSEEKYFGISEKSSRICASSWFLHFRLQCLVASFDAVYDGSDFWFRGKKTDRAEGRNKISHLSVP